MNFIRKLIFLVLILVLWAAPSIEAKTYTTEYKNPDQNMGEIEIIYVEPILYGPTVSLDDFDKLRIQTIMQAEFKGLPVELVWTSPSIEELAKSDRIAFMSIEILQYDRNIYESESYYSNNTNNPVIFAGYHYDYYHGSRDHYRGGHRKNRYHDYSPAIGIGFSFGSSNTSSHIKSEIYTESYVESRFTLYGTDEANPFWVFNQERVQLQKKKTTNPDKDLEKIAQEAQKELKKVYQTDRKIVKKEK